MPINQFDPANRAMLENIQGNILKSHGREHTINLFINGRDGKQKEIRHWISSLVKSGQIQSGYKQLKSSQNWKKHRIDAGDFACIHISHVGYQYLLGKGKVKKITEINLLFGKTMKAAGLEDNPAEFEAGLATESHLLLILANNNKEALNHQADVIRLQLNSFADVVYEQAGDAIKNPEGAGIEHFGYVDGVSQPLFFEDEVSNYRKENGNPAQLTYDPSANPDLVLVDDPFTGEAQTFGSFLVFRKLEQDVYGFKKAEEDLADSLGLKGEDKERAGAMIVGRFEDGTPVEISEEPELINNAVINDFDYDFNNESKCPYHAHIRKTNPRSDLKNSEIKGDAKTHVMARRGITFGKRLDDPNDGILETKPRGGVGLLFMSYQASIENQFEVIQKLWSNNEDFINRKTGGKVGLDLIIGQGDSKALGGYATKWGDPNSIKQRGFDLFVTTHGGGYYFAPSIPFLESLELP
jgi:Dyp-type peroxidase family